MTDRLEELVVLGEDDLRHVAELYGLGEVTEAELCAGGLINSNYRVATASGSFLVRVYPADRAPAEVEFELSLLRHLDERGFPAQRPVPATTGALIGELRGHPYSVLTYLPGHTLTQKDLSVDLARQVGAAYARFRRAVAGFRPAGSRAGADHPAVAELTAKLLADLPPGEHADLVAAAWAASEQRFRPGADDLLEVVHADLYYENILVRDGRLVAFIDFDDAYLGLPELDLALVTMEFATPEDDLLDPALAGAVLGAYREAGEPVPFDAAGLHAALLFLCCKFLGYTAVLSQNEPDGLGGNPYLRRMADLSSPAGVQRVRDALTVAEAAR
jgi:homoserine kinase type II